MNTILLHRSGGPVLALQEFQMTLQDMYDIAMEEGAALLHISRDVFLKVTDEGCWYLQQFDEVKLTELEAREILVNL